MYRPYGEEGEKRALPYTDPRGRGGHSYIQTLRGGGGGEGTPIYRP